MKIFISYRRDDSVDVTGRIRDHLAEHYEPDAIYMDVDSIPIGVDFREHIDSAVRQCDVLLAVIGSDWITAVDSRGQRRLDDPGDIVRLEIEAALRRNVPVVPVLVRGAAMPVASDLPLSLQSLAYRQAALVRRDPDFRPDMARLIAGLRQHDNTQGVVTAVSAGAPTSIEDAVQPVSPHPSALPPPPPPGSGPVRNDVTVDRRAADVAGSPRRRWSRRWIAAAVGVAAVVGLAVLFRSGGDGESGPPDTTSETGRSTIATTETAPTTLAPSTTSTVASTTSPTTATSTSTSQPPTTPAPVISSTTKTVVPGALRPPQTAYDVQPCSGQWIGLLASVYYDTGRAEALLAEARADYPAARLLEKTASCPSLINGRRVRIAAYAGPFQTPAEALAPCRASAQFVDNGCYAAQLSLDQVPNQIDASGNPKVEDYVARADGWPIYDRPDEAGAVVGETNVLENLEPDCQVVGPMVETAGEYSNLWTRIKSPFAGYISDMAVIGTASNDWDPSLPKCS